MRKVFHSPKRQALCKKFLPPQKKEEKEILMKNIIAKKRAALQALGNMGSDQQNPQKLSEADKAIISKAQAMQNLSQAVVNEEVLQPAIPKGAALKAQAMASLSQVPVNQEVVQPAMPEGAAKKAEAMASLAQVVASQEVLQPALPQGVVKKAQALASLAQIPAGTVEQGKPGIATEAAIRLAASQDALSKIEPKADTPKSFHEEDQARARVQTALEGLGKNEIKNESVHILKNSLNGGEMAPDMAARFDQPRWQNGCYSLQNMVPLPTGGITKRPGFEKMGYALGQSRLVPFIFSSTEARILEFYPCGSGAGMRVWLPNGYCIATDILIPISSASYLPDICFCQSRDVVWYAHPTCPPGKIMRLKDDQWQQQTLDFQPKVQAPVIQELFGGGDNTQAYYGPFSTYYYVVTAIDPETSQESRPSAAAKIENTKTLSASSWHIAVKFQPVPSVREYRIYRREFNSYGFVGRVSYEENEAIPEVITFLDKAYSPDTEDAPMDYRNHFGKTNCYPSLVFMHQQRLGFAASYAKPLTIWLSPTADFETMGASIPPEDDDAIEVTLAAPQANAILWTVSDAAGLVVGTEGGEWILKSTEGSALTPKDLSFLPQSWHGSQAGLQPVRAGGTILYAQRGGIAVREIGYSYQDDKYISADLSLLARHILRHNPITSWCWQPEPYGIVWCALRDGTIAALTYLREHDVVAWHRHKTAGKVLSLASIPGIDGNWQVWAIVQRNNLTQVERLRSFPQTSPVPADNFLDDQSTYEARCIPCLAEIQTNNGNSALQVKKINAVKFRVINSKPFKVRALGQNNNQQSSYKNNIFNGNAPLNVPARPDASNLATIADWHCPLAAGFREFAQIEIILDGPDPVTILGLSATCEIATEGGGQL